MVLIYFLGLDNISAGVTFDYYAGACEVSKKWCNKGCQNTNLGRMKVREWCKAEVVNSYSASHGN